MTMLSGLTSMFAQPAFQAVAAGLLTGAVIGSTVVASGILPLEPQREDPKFVALLACPGGGPELARVPAGQQLLITARSEDGAWLEVYIGGPGVEFAWAPAPALRAASALDALPISACDTSQTFLPTLGPPDPTDAPPTGVPGTVLPTIEPTPGPTLEPGATPTPTPRVTASPTPKPTPTKTATPTPTAVPPTPTPTPDPPTPTPEPPNNPPDISGLSRSAPCIDIGFTYTQSVVTVTASDPDPGDTIVVRLRIGYRDAFNNQFYRLGSYAMTPIGNNQYSFTITKDLLTSFNWNTSDREVTADVTARDNHGVDSATLFSHNLLATQIRYQPVSSCSPIG